MTHELAEDIVQWDVRSWSKAILYWEKKVDWTQIQNALELGGREGGLSLWLALKGKRTICSDLKNVRTTAEPLHLKYRVTSFITYQDIDATNIPYENYFDLVVFKSVIGGIGRNNNYQSQQNAFMEIHKALKPGGKLLFAENLVASPIHRWLRKRFVNWGSSWRYVSVNELNDCLRCFTSYELRTTGVLAAFGRTEKQRRVLSVFDKMIFNRICPAHWKYIAYGIAVK